MDYLIFCYPRVYLIYPKTISYNYGLDRGGG